ncbi:CD82 antigen-like [Python bivittatus]|uniref:Tetraspanin n=1 Tax=Python bivittatus TaxID=176946 RepID=A0A9F5J4B7_PYTBI|nr:CD82 antigen-like [Python bivittatus]
MGFCCVKVTMYLFFFFNHLFFILGALMVGFGTWILVDRKSFMPILQNSVPTFQAGVCVFIGVGAITMVLGLLGCLGALCGIQCVLGLLKARMPQAVADLFQTYDPSDEVNQTLETAWDFVQSQLSCCGWTGPENWQLNKILWNRKLAFYPCSCSNETADALIGTGFCILDTDSNTTTVADWPVKKQGCQTVVENWLQDNFDIFLGVCIGVAITELLGIGLSICLCKGKICQC